MNKIYTLCFLLLFSFAGFAQDDDGPGGKLQEKMTEYIQKRMGLSRGEAERFSPVFLDYFKELRRANRDFRGDPLVLQQKVTEVRLRFRDQFKPIVGEKRSNDVFTYEKEFIKELKEIRQERLQNRLDGRANKRGENKLP